MSGRSRQKATIVAVANIAIALSVVFLIFELKITAFGIELRNDWRLGSNPDTKGEARGSV